METNQRFTGDLSPSCGMAPNFGASAMFNRRVTRRVLRELGDVAGPFFVLVFIGLVAFGFALSH